MGQRDGLVLAGHSDSAPDTRSPAGTSSGRCAPSSGDCSLQVVLEVHLNLEGAKGIVTWKYKTSCPASSSAPLLTIISSLGTNWSQNNKYAGRDPKYTKREQGIAKLRGLTRICVCSSWRFSHNPCTFLLLHTLSLLLPWQHLSPQPLTTPHPPRGDKGTPWIQVGAEFGWSSAMQTGSVSNWGQLPWTAVSPRCKNL